LFSSILQDGKGNDVDLATYKGKVLLIVNVASKWYAYAYISILSFIHFIQTHQFGSTYFTLSIAAKSALVISHVHKLFSTYS